MRFGTVAIVGRTNVGKSTFLNAVLGEPLAVVSPRPQTTRDALLGIVTLEDAQIAFIDTPGLHQAKNELGRRMNATARDAARGADLVVLMTDVTAAMASQGPVPKTPVLPEDEALLREIPAGTPCLVIINKIDLLRDKSRLLPIIAALHEIRPLEGCVPVSALAEDGIERVLRAIAEVLPEGPKGYDESALTDRPTRYFAQEYIREQVLLTTRGEVPHATAVTIDEFSEGPKLAVIKATIHVEKPGQRTIVVGRGGAKIKEIGIGARRRLEQLVGRKVHLELFVRVTPRWKSHDRMLSELGYEEPKGREK